MSRKSRPRKKIDLVRETSADETLDADPGTWHELTGELRQTFDAIIAGCTVMTQEAAAASAAEYDDDGNRILDVGPEDAMYDDLGDDDIDEDELEDDELDELSDSLGAIVVTTRVFARSLVARVLAREPEHVPPQVTAFSDGNELEIDGGILDELARSLLPPTLLPSRRLSREEREAVLDEAALLLQEIALEEFDTYCDINVRRDGTPELYTYPLSPEGAHVSLLEFLFNRAEAVADNADPLLTIERDASAWEFECWSVAPPAGTTSLEVASFSRSVREQEYSLAERPTVALGVSVMEQLAVDDGFAELFPRQHHLARSLTASLVGVFECVALDGARATLRSALDGQTYEVFEHMIPVTYAVGWLCLGRLLPFDGTLCLRSPGMIFVKPNGPTLALDAVRALERYDEVLPPALTLEAVIASVVFGLTVPRPTKPMRSRADARVALETMTEMLASAEPAPGFVGDVTARDASSSAAEDSPRVPSYYVPGANKPAEPESGVRLDATLDAFLAALSEQANAGGAPAGRRRTDGRRKKQKSKRR